MSELFSFSGRIGRLHYVLAIIGIAIGFAIGAVCLGMLAASLRAVPLFAILAVVCFVPLGLAVSWVGLALQARRFRDIGWEPILVIPAWFAVQILDVFAAKAFPDFSIKGQGHSTVVGFALSITLTLVLLFMPGADDEPAGVLPRRIA